MFNLTLLSAEDRELYDNTMYDSAIQPSGEVYPTSEAGARLYSAMLNLSESGHDWAGEYIESCAIQAMGRRAKEWAKSQCLIETADGDEKLVSKSAYVATKRRNGKGSAVDQLVLWETATRDDLLNVLQRGDTMIHGIRIDMATASKLLGLLDKHNTYVVTDALTIEGATIEEFLREAAS